MIKTSKEDRADLDLLVLGFLTKHKGTPRCQLHFIVQGVSLPKDMRKALKNQTGHMRTRPDQETTCQTEQPSPNHGLAPWRIGGKKESKGTLTMEAKAGLESCPARYWTRMPSTN